MKKAKLVILRHGQTKHNELSLMTGQLDVPLTALGEEQAREAGRLITHIRFDAAYSSTLSRAFNTASLTLEAAGQKLTVEQRAEIMELDTGDFTGRNHKTDPEIIAFLRLYDVRLPGGESEKDAVERVRKFFDDEVLPRLARGENVLVVAHAGIVRAFDVVLGLKTPPAPGEARAEPKRKIPNASPTVYEYEDGVMKSHYTFDNPKGGDAANQNLPSAVPGRKKGGPA